jgi:hypothetical protein
MNKHEIFAKELKTFNHDDIRSFAEALLDDAPDYFFHVAASSTGRYHPKYALGELGLVRHTKSVIRFYNHIVSVEQNNTLFTEREIDLGRIACLAHDILKSGTQEYYNEKSNNGESTVYTVFNHPLLSAKHIMSYKDKYLSEEELKFIALAIGSHMGQWNSNKHEPDIILPKPKTEMQKIVHLADYLASRKDIDVSFIDDDDAYPPIEPGDFKLTFGKHSGVMLKDVPKDYLKWLVGTELKEPLKTYVIEVLKTN